MDDFAGPSFHSARWDHDVDLTGQAGRARSAPAPAASRSRRPSPTRSSTSPCSSAPRSGCSRTRTTTSTVGPGVRWALRHLPFYGRWYRFLLFWPGVRRRPRRRPDRPRRTPTSERAVSEMNELTRQMFTDWITSQVGDDPELVAKVRARLPGHRQAHAAGQRQLAAHASRATTSSSCAPASTTSRPTGSSPSTATRHEVDVIVLRHRVPGQQRFLWPMEIVGPRRRGPRASSGASGRRRTSASPCPSFPNLFCMYGPGTNLAHGGSLIFHSECQMRYITGCIDLLLARRRPAMEPQAEVHDDYYERTQREIEGPACGPSRRSSTRGSRTRTARSTCSARGGSSTTGAGRSPRTRRLRHPLNGTVRPCRSP